MKILDIKVGDIPLKVFRPEGFNENTKTIIHYHGWTSNVDKFLSYAKLFAAKGYQVILPEVIHHGEREKIEDTLDEMIFLKVVVHTIEEYDIIHKYLVENEMINKDKLILTGHSMGGFIVNILRGLKSNLISSISFNGIGNIFDLSPKEVGDFEGKIEDAKIVNRIIELNPASNYQRYDGKQMYVLIGEQDNTVQPSNMEKLFDEMKKSSLNLDNIEIKYFPDANHDMNMSMVKSALKYVEKF